MLQDQVVEVPSEVIMQIAPEQLARYYQSKLRWAPLGKEASDSAEMVPDSQDSVFPMSQT